MSTIQPITPTDLDFLKSLNGSDLEAILRDRPESERLSILKALLEPPSGHGKDLLRKREQSSAAAEVKVPAIVNPKRRERCLKDPELFLRTYGAPEPGLPVELQDGTIWMPFAKHHKAMIDAIYQRAKTGGDKAVAAPRGDGKSTVVFWMLIYIVLAELRHHPAGFGQTNAKAKEKLFDPIRYHFTRNQMLFEDFPEICAPMRDLDGAPQRRHKQHFQGIKTDIMCAVDMVRLPIIGAGPYNDASPYGGCTWKYYGFDVAKRGSRHDFAAIDDPETDEVAMSEEQNRKIEKKIDGDIAGMAFPNSTMPRVVITTIQNRHCFSYRVTSRDIKEGGRPTFEGERYGILESFPDSREADDDSTDPSPREMWDEYVSIRQQAQAEGDKDGIPAVKYFKKNRKRMERGSVVSNSARYDHRNPHELSALQAFFNRVADWGLARVMAELQNNPEEEYQPQTIGLTAGLVQSRISRFERNELPKLEGIKITCGIDLGKNYSHWVKIAWFGNATGIVIDYGILETSADLTADSSHEAIERAILNALRDEWRPYIIAEHPPDFTILDSSAYTQGVYEFVRQCSSERVPFAAGKGQKSGAGGGGQGRFIMPDFVENKKLPFLEVWAHNKIQTDNIWLYNVHTQWWRAWLQERFITKTFDDQQQFNAGTLSLYSHESKRKHQTIAHHICAWKFQQLYIEGKGFESKWVSENMNDHFLDAMTYACAAAGVIGVRLVQRAQPEVEDEPKKKRPKPKPVSNRFPKREGGWVQGVRR